MLDRIWRRGYSTVQYSTVQCTLTVGECLDHQEDVEVGGEVAEAAQESSHVHGEQLGWCGWMKLEKSCMQ